MESSTPNGGGGRGGEMSSHDVSASSANDAPHQEMGSFRGDVHAGSSSSIATPQDMHSSGADSGVEGVKGERTSSARTAAGGESAGTASPGACEGERGERAGAVPASKDAWSSLRGKMCLEEMLYETSQRAKVYNRNHYGLLGILKVIRMTDPDLNILALGTDLTSLGLNLNSPDCLFSSFGSPWSDAPAARDAESLLPSCYLPPVPPTFKLSHLEKVHEHTLFYIFYCCPRLLLQGCAAAELYNRSWQYHKTWKKWFLEGEPSQAGGTRAAAGAAEGGKEGEGVAAQASEGAADRPGDSGSATEGRGTGKGNGERESVKREDDAKENGKASARPEQEMGEEGSGDRKSGGSAEFPRWIYFEPAAWSRREFRGVLDPSFLLKAEEVRQSVEEGVRQVRAQQQLQHQQLQQLQHQHQQQVSVQQQAAVQHLQHFSQQQKAVSQQQQQKAVSQQQQKTVSQQQKAVSQQPQQPQLHTSHVPGMSLASSQSNNAGHHSSPQIGASALSAGQAAQTGMSGWNSVASSGGGAAPASAGAAGGGASGGGGR
ncbi:NOT2 / NOT3 / NOT5 family protein [Besnoitia besnoiti]|uniref:NOT2 / NOT3 / NOT5 family protein n=1 Tax=Besnoitia besnoiti TaxID=94643 RepID=A0A2A9MDP6_BESBE|nr:NOT2 / NOT3 / NOT5 family protein [Besnoitia besnoiti]PFH33512.1 NOT2 / NOT3 / NOT5 family protein [Besnoitia besnoiti]